MNRTIVSDENDIEAGGRGDIASLYSADQTVVNGMFQIVHKIIRGNHLPRHEAQVTGYGLVKRKQSRGGFIDQH